jgi:hypothetical protein
MHLVLHTYKKIQIRLHTNLTKMLNGQNNSLSSAITDDSLTRIR